ncbi:hypoxanthine phosphoribosyltransferase [Hufsiella ginkgonis]|uniref:Hypoxanthine phosphoribosyltransferase n=1 Tax=Hufsiella ginkgonis TaxID=2695274 RepID=A0A7K1XVA1_9SPHI|nr:hypoxanthine phosphoribosyltransferase [Hufsiella ginkgonis]MXV14727.1 hypoxanthine phosphoribosyltransferase [Hufsiella ginkgonis]
MKIQVDDKEFELMIEYEQIKKRIRLIGIQLNVDYEGRVPVFIGVLNGSFLFLADLMKEIEIASEVTFIKVSSYEGDSSTGRVKKVIGLELDLRKRDVIIVEDIVDTGITMDHLLTELKQLEPASIAVCSLLVKPQSMQHEIEELDYVAFEIPNDFVVGYGLDYNGLGRNLKDIYRAVAVPSET